GCRRVGGGRRHRRRRRGHDRHRLAGRAGRAHHRRLPGRLPHRRDPRQRRGHLGPVPLRGVVPRRRRHRAQGRRRRALVPGGLHRGLPGAAVLRGRAAAPLRGLHGARLRRGPPRLHAPAHRHHVVRRDHRLALPAAAAAGRRPRAHGADHRAALGRHRGRRPRGHRQRDLRRHALDDLRPGVPVLAQAHRARRARPGAGRGVRPRPVAVRRAAPARVHRRHQRRREHPGDPPGPGPRGDRGARRGRRRDRQRTGVLGAGPAPGRRRHDAALPGRQRRARGHRRRPGRRVLVGSAHRGQRGRALAARDVLADPRAAAGHHGPAARPRALLHQPRRPGRAPHDGGRAGHARRLLPAAGAARRPLAALRAAAARHRADRRRGAAAADGGAAGLVGDRPRRPRRRRGLRRVPVDVLGTAALGGRGALDRPAAPQAGRLPHRRARRRRRPDRRGPRREPARLLAHRLARLRRRGVDLLPAARAGHLVEGAHRPRGDDRHARRRRGRRGRRRLDAGGARARRVGRGAPGPARARHRPADLPRHGVRQPVHGAPRARQRRAHAAAPARAGASRPRRRAARRAPVGL
ncbi:MAG: Putative transmembrane transport protein, partial [uncultured Actinomycetospora sp.]